MQPADLPIEQLGSNAQLSETEKVSELSRQFEAVLLRQILSNAQKTVFASSMNPESVSSGIYQDLITNQLADNISRSRAFGLARTLEGQLQHQVDNGSGNGQQGSKKL